MLGSKGGGEGSYPFHVGGSLKCALSSESVENLMHVPCLKFRGQIWHEICKVPTDPTKMIRTLLQCLKHLEFHVVHQTVLT